MSNDETPASTHNPETGERLAWAFPTPPETLPVAVQMAVGGASACWDNLEGAGVFQDEKALEISSVLIKWINEHYVSKVAAEEMRQQAVGDYQRKVHAGTPVEGQTTFGSKPVYIDRAGRTHEL